MQKTLASAVGAVLLASTGLLSSADGIAQSQSGRVAAATEAQQRSDFSRVLESVKALNQALKRVAEQKKLDKADVVAQAESKIRQAEATAADGKIVEARLALDEAYLNIKSALIEAAQSGAVGAVPAKHVSDESADRRKSQFVARRESTKSLNDALKRIAQEKNDAKGADEAKVIDRLIQRSEDLVAQGDLAQGRAVLDHGYLRAKLQIERLRGGDTLVRSLHFESKEEEYRYELDRNDTFGMLVNMLVPGDASTMKDSLDKARRTRKEAEGMATRKKFDEAIKALEDSTGNYQRAIRQAGVYIPG